MKHTVQNWSIIQTELVWSTEPPANRQGEKIKATKNGPYKCACCSLCLSWTFDSYCMLCSWVKNRWYLFGAEFSMPSALTMQSGPPFLQIVPLQPLQPSLGWSSEGTQPNLGVAIWRSARCAGRIHDEKDPTGWSLWWFMHMISHDPVIVNCRTVEHSRKTDSPHGSCGSDLVETAVQRAIHEDVDDTQSLVPSPHSEYGKPSAELGTIFGCASQYADKNWLCYRMISICARMHRWVYPTYNSATTPLITTCQLRWQSQHLPFLQHQQWSRLPTQYIWNMGLLDGFFPWSSVQICQTWQQTIAWSRVCVWTLAEVHPCFEILVPTSSTLFDANKNRKYTAALKSVS